MFGDMSSATIQTMLGASAARARPALVGAKTTTAATTDIMTRIQLMSDPFGVARRRRWYVESIRRIIPQGGNRPASVTIRSRRISFGKWPAGGERSRGGLHVAFIYRRVLRPRLDARRICAGDNPTQRPVHRGRRFERLGRPARWSSSSEDAEHRPPRRAGHDVHQRTLPGA